MKKKVGLIVLLFIGVVMIFDQLVIPFYISQGRVVVVPDVTNLRYENAERKLREAGFKAKKSYYVKYISRVNPNIVLSQMPLAGMEVKPGRNVYLVLNKKEKPTFLMPDFLGKTEFDVRQTASRLELMLNDMQTRPVNKSEEDGKVLNQSIPPQTVISPGASVSIIIGRYQASSEGIKKVTVPDVLGMSLTQATQAINDAGLTLGKITTEYSAILIPNTVISQKPAVSSSVSPGQKIELTVVTAE
ncbi:MAG: PASTA domain-containing protein [Chlorobiaceae bacterium]